MGAEKLYAVPLGQGRWVAKICWGTCGKGCIGGIGLGEKYGEAIPCITPASECPAFDVEVAFCNIEDPHSGEERPVYLRKLKRPVDVR